MFWRLKRSEFDAQKGAGNKRAFKRIVSAGPPPGLLGYVDGAPAAWISVGPREDYSSLERSRILKPVDDKAVWSISCFFVARAHRRKGHSLALLKQAGEYAKSQGARILEGYPVEPKSGRSPDPFVWTGLASAFLRAGFKEVARRSPTRPIMRKRLG